MAERHPNIRSSSILERNYGNEGRHHGRRLIPEARQENQSPYRGSHRAESRHHADEHTAAQQRSSRVGRHHAEHSEDLSNRW